MPYREKSGVGKRAINTARGKMDQLTKLKLTKNQPKIMTNLKVPKVGKKLITFDITKSFVEFFRWQVHPPSKTLLSPAGGTK